MDIPVKNARRRVITRRKSWTPMTGGQCDVTPLPLALTDLSAAVILCTVGCHAPLVTQLWENQLGTNAGNFLGFTLLVSAQFNLLLASVTFQLSGLDNFPWTPMHMPFAHEENLALALLSRSIYPGMKYGFSCLVPCSNHTGHLSLIIAICQPSTIITSPRHHLCTYVPIKSHIYT